MYIDATPSVHVWVTNNHEHRVIKLRLGDGKVIGGASVGQFPLGIAFDGANIWVANTADNTVSKL
jgi:DNA-binding beta-propeller fold protein YncE